MDIKLFLHRFFFFLLTYHFFRWFRPDCLAAWLRAVRKPRHADAALAPLLLAAARGVGRKPHAPSFCRYAHNLSQAWFGRVGLRPLFGWMALIFLILAVMWSGIQRSKRKSTSSAPAVVTPLLSNRSVSVGIVSAGRGVCWVRLLTSSHQLLAPPLTPGLVKGP